MKENAASLTGKSCYDMKIRLNLGLVSHRVIMKIRLHYPGSHKGIPPIAWAKRILIEGAGK